MLDETMEIELDNEFDVINDQVSELKKIIIKNCIN